MAKILYILIVTSCVDDNCASIQPYTFEKLEDCKKVEMEYLATNKYLPNDNKIRFVSAFCKPVKDKG